MAKPARNADPDKIASSIRTFFVSTKTSQGCPLLQSERNAALMIDVLRGYVAARKFRVHDFVVMPNHVHLLMTVDDGVTIEKAMQLNQGQLLLPLEEGIGIHGRGLAARVQRRAGGGPPKLLAASGVHCEEPGESRSRRFAREVPILLYIFE